MKVPAVVLTLISVPAYAHGGFHGGGFGGGGFHGGFRDGFHGSFRGGGFVNPYVSPGYACQWTNVPVTDDYGNIVGYNQECL